MCIASPSLDRRFRCALVVNNVIFCLMITFALLIKSTSFSSRMFYQGFEYCRLFYFYNKNWNKSLYASLFNTFALLDRALRSVKMYDPNTDYFAISTLLIYETIKRENVMLYRS